MASRDARRTVESLLRLCTLLAVATAAGCPEPEPATYSLVQERVFTPRCSSNSCHGGVDPEAGMDLSIDPYDVIVDVPSDADPGVLRVDRFHPDTSLLYQLLLNAVGDVERMPVDATLPADEVDLVRRWIESGTPKI